MDKEKPLRLETERLIIARLTMDMAESVHINSLDADNRRFVPDEVFETPEDARKTIAFLISRYGGAEGPFVYALLKNEICIGHVQAVRIQGGWELGYHVARPHTGRGYATEAVKAFLPAAMELLRVDEIFGICLAENAASRAVLERCGFYKVFEGVDVYQGASRVVCKYVWLAGGKAQPLSQRIGG